MSKIWEFFENLDEYVYVADIETHELVYMNQKALKAYGFRNNEEIAGLKCYEILQGNFAPCSFCNNEQLRSGYFKEWEYYNAVLKIDFHIKDTLVEDNGRLLRMEIAIDCGNPRQQKSLDYRKMEAALNQAMRVALRQSTPNQTLAVLLEFLGKVLEADRTYIFEKNDHGHDDNTYEWVAKGVTPEKATLQDLPPEVCAQWYQKFEENQNIVTENLEDIKEKDPTMYEVLARQNIHSLVVVPLYDDEKVIGFYGVDNPPARYFDYVLELLQIMGHFIVSSIKRRNLVRELEYMSYTDQLTGMGNRYAMEKYIAEIKPEEKIGIVYCDVTGLKRVNDEEGHSAGDRMIRQCCECLKHIFAGHGIFRIGGDELVVLCRGIEEKEFYHKAEDLKADLKANHVTMAVGTAVTTRNAVDENHLLTEAERRMYQDKAEYYHNTGLDRRKR